MTQQLLTLLDIKRTLRDNFVFSDDQVVQIFSDDQVSDDKVVRATIGEAPDHSISRGRLRGNFKAGVEDA